MNYKGVIFAHEPLEGEKEFVDSFQRLGYICVGVRQYDSETVFRLYKDNKTGTFDFSWFPVLDTLDMVNRLEDFSQKVNKREVN